MRQLLNIKSQGFTLLELITVMAIIGILASSIMVTLSVQKKRAVVGRVLTEMSAAMQNIYLCKSDDGTINAPNNTGGNNICSFGGVENANYGQWPDVSAATLGDGMNFVISRIGDFNSSTGWAYWATPTGTGVSGADTICCNSKSGKCGKVSSGGCNANTIIK